MIRVNDFKRSYLFKKRLEDLPLVIVFMNNKATYRLCRFNYNGYYYKYVCFGLTASAWEDDILKVHSKENKRREIEEKRIRIENELLDFLKVRGVYN